MGGSAMLGAIAFDPTIRGILVVVVAVTILMGSIFMILATNSGARVAFLISTSGFFGWMVIMALIWTIYGIGLVGRAPAWMTTDINLSRETAVPAVPQLDELPPAEELPVAEDLLAKYPLLQALAYGSEGADYVPQTLTKLKTLVQPWVVVSDEDLTVAVTKSEEAAPDFIADNPEVAALFAAGGDELTDEVHQQAAALREEIQGPLGEWCLLTESDPRRGEAVASSDASLIAEEIFGQPTATSDYIVKDVYFYGGKESCEPMEESSTLDRVWHRVKTVFQVPAPKLLAAVTVVKTEEVVVEPGGTPPPATADPKASQVTVVMLRNLGNKRFLPFIVLLVSLMGFIMFTTILHYRDKHAMEIRAAFGGASKGK